MTKYIKYEHPFAYEFGLDNYDKKIYNIYEHPFVWTL